ncbi:hypothetical protein AX16_001292 [Volvariella volvacea WC 439]|nr:hypothetical protein AX16_001292 [Volvariella volvacea WC 439]
MIMDSGPFVEPRLPQDLERTIFEMAALSDRRKLLPVLIQVAHRVRNWLEPLLDEIVVLQADSLHNCPSSIFPNRRPYYPQSSRRLHVKHVLGFGGVPHASEPDWLSFLQGCYNLQSLAVWRDIIPETLSCLVSIIHSPLRTVSPSGLLRLSASLHQLFGPEHVNFNHEVLKDITHLEMLDYSAQLAQWIPGNNPGCLKQLRYLSFASLGTTGPFPLQYLNKCLEECEALEMIILSGSRENERNADKLAKTRKMRKAEGTSIVVAEDRVVVVAELYTLRGWYEDWYAGVEGNDDIWSKGERILRERRRERIVASG